RHGIYGCRAGRGVGQGTSSGNRTSPARIDQVAACHDVCSEPRPPAHAPDSLRQRSSSKAPQRLARLLRAQVVACPLEQTVRSFYQLYARSAAVLPCETRRPGRSLSDFSAVQRVAVDRSGAAPSVAFAQTAPALLFRAQLAKAPAQLSDKIGDLTFRKELDEAPVASRFRSPLPSRGNSLYGY